MKTSIRKTFLTVFALTLVLVIVICGLFSYWNTFNEAIREVRDIGQSCAHQVGAMIRTVGLDRLCDPKNTVLYAQIRETLREYCQVFSMGFLYLYTVDEAEHRHYIVTVANDPEDDALVAERLGLGAVSSFPLQDQEREALRGNRSVEPIWLDNTFGHTATWVTPYTDESGRVVALIGTDFDMEIGSGVVLRRFMTIILPVVAVLLAAFTVLFLLLRYRVLAPVRIISRRMAEFDPSGEPEPLEIKSRDEMRQIADGFNKMSGDIRAYLDNIRTITAERAQEAAQLEAARSIQYGMVPARFRDLRAGLDAAASMATAKAVGGDFYDCFPRSDGKYCAVIGDVSGKGVSAALFMAMVKSTLRVHLREGADPAETLNRVNDELCNENPAGMFVTVFACVLDTAKGTLRYANAGHTRPLLLRDGGAVFLEPDPGCVLGLFEDADIVSAELPLRPGEGILLYTDGVTEAVDARRQFFGEDRLRQAFAGGIPADSEKAVETVNGAVEAFSAGCERFDDLTLLSLIYRGG